VILRASVKWTLKFDLAFGPAFLIALLVVVTNWIANALIGLMVGAAFVGAGRGGLNTGQALASIVPLPFDFMLDALIFGLLVKFPREVPVPYPTVAPAPGTPLSYATPQQHAGLGGQPIGLGKGALVTLVCMAIALAITIVIVGLVLGVVFATGTRL
jgi:hypothetical protein